MVVKIIFIDLRDREGLAQVVFTPQQKETYAKARQVRSEWLPIRPDPPSPAAGIGAGQPGSPQPPAGFVSGPN